MRALVLAAIACVCAVPWAHAAGTSQQPKKGVKANDPAGDPYTQNDPELLKAAGIVSLGGFDFGKTGNNTDKVDEFMATSEIRWIETEHFKLGFGLGPYKVKLEEKKKIVAELTRLKAALPKVVPDTGILDPWLRTHLFAQRIEDSYKRFLEITAAGSAVFADGSGKWQGHYQGEGPYLGMKLKYEILILPTEAAHVAFLLENAGLRVKNTQRWHFVDRGCINVMMHAQQGKLRDDSALHGHVAFNIAHNLYDGLNHYSYDTPVWLHEGLAHFMEREIDPKYNSFDSGEGATADMTSKANWKPEVLKLITSGEAPRMAELMSLKSYAELKLPHHYTTWSMVDFLETAKPKEFANFLWALKKHYDERGMPTGDNLPDWVRKQFKEQLGYGYAEFDEAWRTWCKENYALAPGKEKEKKGEPEPGKDPAPPKGDPGKDPAPPKGDPGKDSGKKDPPPAPGG
jgi:hypothetical protein